MGGVIYQYLPVDVGLALHLISIFIGRPIRLHRELSSIINHRHEISSPSHTICRHELYDMSSQTIQYVVTNYTICRHNYTICRHKLYNMSSQTIR